MKKFTILMALFLATVITGQANAGWFSTKTEGQILVDEMIDCYETIIETWNGKCAGSFIPKAEKYSEEYGEIPESEITHDLPEEEWKSMAMTLALAYTCIVKEEQAIMEGEVSWRETAWCEKFTEATYE